ncbi:hypothetical protein K2Q00_03825 [Patescibacteria group bacterium]|nr:hypothetical protein [Patescibacteria group bacterium]
MDDSTPPSALGPIVATIIIVVLFIAGGVYFLIKQEQRAKAIELQNEQAQLPANS